jgi:hypothetical protein
METYKTVFCQKENENSFVYTFIVYVIIVEPPPAGAGGSL